MFSRSLSKEIIAEGLHQIFYVYPSCNIIEEVKPLQKNKNLSLLPQYIVVGNSPLQ